MNVSFRAVVGLSAVLFLATGRPSEAQGFDYQFNADGVLPSAQLATYYGSSPENAVFSVSGGYLHQNTVPFSPSTPGWYELYDAFDHSIDARLTFRAKLLQCSPSTALGCAGGAGASVTDDGYAWVFVLTPEGLWTLNPAGVWVALVPNGLAALPNYNAMNEHTYRIDIPANSSAYTVYVDGHLVASAGAWPFAYPSYAWFGDGTPTGGNASVEWDFVTLENTQVNYNICTLYDQTRAVREGAAYPIKLRICDAAGNNLSSSEIVLNAVSVSRTSGEAPGAVLDAGNANADNNFRYDSALSGYVFNLKTTGLTSGTYSLNFRAGDDPRIHSVPFQVK